MGITETQGFWAEIARGDYFGWVLFLGFVLAIVIVRSVAGVIKTVARERTKREIAAYIAEGSMSPEQGERMVRAGSHD